MRLLAITLLSVFIFISCSRNDNSDMELMRDVKGKLIWGGSPAVDGTGLILHSDEDGQDYGVPGDRGDFDDIFSGPSNEVAVIADFYITDNETVRGWGVTFTEIRIVDIERLEDSTN